MLNGRAKLLPSLNRIGEDKQQCTCEEDGKTKEAQTGKRVRERGTGKKLS